MRIGAYIGIGLLALVLAGCAPDVPGLPSVPPTPSVAPLFASEEEALAAAEEAYAAYLAVTDDISADGGAEPTRIADLVTPEQLVRELETYEYFVENDLHTEGHATFDSMKLQQLQPDSLVVYVCVDTAGIKTFKSGELDTSPRSTRIPLEVGFASGADRNPLLIASSEQWPSSDFCS